MMTKKTSLITNEIIRRLNEANVKPRKLLGQNFLVNEGAYDKIIDIAQIKPNDTIIEIGPGLGILTDRIAGTCKKLIAIEKDKKISDYLARRYEATGNIILVNQDILRFNPEDYDLEGGDYKVIGNIPYYLTSHLIRRILEFWPIPKSVILTIQKEVAQRITATPPNMSLLAVAVQFYAQVSTGGQISRGSFYPVPKIDSSIIKLTPLTQPPDKKFAKHFFQIVHAGFAGKRKQLGGNLARNLKMTKETVKAKLLLIGVAYQRRAETVSMEEWLKITKILL